MKQAPPGGPLPSIGPSGTFAAVARIQHEVKVGSEAAFEQELRQITSAAARRPGFLGTEVLWADADEQSSRYCHVVVRFATDAQLVSWRSSPEAEVGRLRLQASTRGPAQVEMVDGIAPWFSLRTDAEGTSPPKWKMAVVTVMVIYPLSLMVAFALEPVSRVLPPWASGLLNVLILVPLLTWVAMPVASLLMRPWLLGTTARER